MIDAAVLGAGPIGRAVAQRLAERDRLRQLLIVDPAVDAATGLALDIRQAGPVSGFDTRLAAASDVLAAASAGVLILADRIEAGEWSGAEGLALVEQLLRAGAGGPFVFAGATHHELMEASASRLAAPRDRLVGTAAAAVAGSVASLAGLELGLASIDVVVTGRPPAFVVGWSAATVAGALVRDRIPAHRLRAISSALPRLWPPGPHAIASATAAIVEALVQGTRRRHAAVTVIDGELGARNTAVLLPVELAHGRVRAHVLPSLSDQERTALVNGLSRHPGRPEVRGLRQSSP
jgi:hypothetical protein